MPDTDVFELRFAAAYRRYLDEAPVEVDAAAVASSVAGDARRRGAGTWAWPRRAMPAGVWVLVLVALLAAALVGAYLIGTRLPMLPVAPVASEPASPVPAPSGQAGLNGTWSSTGDPVASLAVHPCRLGEVCGRFELTADHGERCVFTLEYRPPRGDAYAYWSIDASSFSCAWGPYWQTEFNVQSATDGTVLVWSQRGVNGETRRSWQLSRISDQYEPQLPPTIVGDWSSVGQHERLHLVACGPGEWCGTLTLLRSEQACSYTLTYRPKAYEEYVFWVASASGAPCDSSGWRQTNVLVRPVAVGQVLLTHDPGVELTLYEPGYGPG